MNADFLDAHYRHVHDAESLFNAARIANADQLFGFAAECGLKKLMVIFGMVTQADGSPASNVDWVHAEKAWARYETYRSSNGAGANYALAAGNPFNDWHVKQRYANSNDVTPAAVEKHRAAVIEVGALIKRAQMEGLV